jgi:hypothetical protein
LCQFIQAALNSQRGLKNLRRALPFFIFLKKEHVGALRLLMDFSWVSYLYYGALHLIFYRKNSFLVEKTIET